VKGFLRRRPIWLTKNLPLDVIRREAQTMEFQAERFYIKAAEHTTDIGVRKLLFKVSLLGEACDSQGEWKSSTVLA
jgi:erythrin-vacuolar iron transport family protein